MASLCGPLIYYHGVINFDKTDMYPLNLDREEAVFLARLFQCRLSKFPFKYLGVPLSDSPLLNKDWGFLIDKFRHKLQGWKGQSLSLGGRITLINSVLSAVPLYILSFYKIPILILNEIDRIRRQFLWQGTQSKRKYALMTWQELCIAKQFGGMGILNLQQMNYALLSKWWWRFKDPHYSNLWKSVLQANLSLPLPVSPFWKAVTAISQVCNLGMSYQPGYQGAVSFWEDTWYEYCPLKIRFYQLYNICTTPQVTVQDVIATQGQCLRFRRSLTGIIFQEWQQILQIISSTAFTHDLDQVAWQWDLLGHYTVKSMYLFFNFQGQLKDDLKAEVNEWLPHDLEIVPLQVSPPEAEQLVEWLSSEPS
ncbi:uncharacterized protein LOC144547363 [Carex rostrata]